MKNETENNKKVESIIKEKILSNDLLGISYIKAILKINDKIIFF